MAHKAEDTQPNALYDLRELRANALRYMATLSFAVAYVWLQSILVRTFRFTVELALPTVLALGALVGLRLRHRRTPLATFSFAGALGIAALGSVSLYGHQTAPYVLVPTVVLAGVLLDPLPMLTMSGFLGAALSGIFWLRLGHVPPASMLVPPLGTIVLTVFGSWLSSHNLRTMLKWALESYERAAKDAELARERRGQLRQAVKSMDEAASRLQRMNFELARARDSAEELRRLKQQFVTGVSHELRTPLALVAGFAEMMYLSPESYGVQLPPEYVGDAREIYRSSQHLLSLIDDILDLSRISAGKMSLTRQKVAPERVIREAIDTMRPLVEGKGLALEVEIDHDLPAVDLDATRIRQVLINLLNNARRFTLEGKIRVQAQREPQMLHVSVSDTGVGIAPAYQARLFDEFERLDAHLDASYEGHGLGLAISKEFVEMHGGRIWMESEGIVGKGSTFHFTLPLQEPEMVDLPLLGSSRPVPRTQPVQTLLLVGEAQDLMPFLRRRLSTYDCLVAATPDRVPEMVRRFKPLAVLVSPAPGREPETVSAVAADLDGSGVPIIALPFVGEAQMARSLGVHAYITKPVRRERLLAAMDALGPTIRHVLIVDDDPSSVRLVARQIHSSGRRYEVQRTYRAVDALRRVREGETDAILLDLLMPAMGGRELLAVLQEDEELARIPVIVLTAQEPQSAGARTPAGKLIAVSQAQGISNEEALVYLQGLLQTLLSRELLVASLAK